MIMKLYGTINYLSIYFIFYLISNVTLAISNVCQDNNHIQGHWKRKSKALKTFDCKSDSGKDITHEKLFYMHGDKLAEAHHHGCECDNKLDTFDANERLMYEWEPRHCELIKWNSTEFCKVLKNQTILFIGDSTMQQTALSVMNRLLYSNGTCGSQLYYGRSNVFVYDVKNIDIKWYHYYEENPTDILILASGAWFEDTGDMWSVLDNINQTIRNWKSKNMKIPKIYWKTQNPGHVNCDAFYYPISYRQEKMLNLSTDASWKFHWENFPKYDQMAKEFAAKEGFKIIDMSPLYLRPDAHISKLSSYVYNKQVKNIDCLHYCLPGNSISKISS